MNHARKQKNKTIFVLYTNVCDHAVVDSLFVCLIFIHFSQCWGWTNWFFFDITIYIRFVISFVCFFLFVAWSFHFSVSSDSFFSVLIHTQKLNHLLWVVVFLFSIYLFPCHCFFFNLFNFFNLFIPLLDCTSRWYLDPSQTVLLFLDRYLPVCSFFKPHLHLHLQSSILLFCYFLFLFILFVRFYSACFNFIFSLLSCGVFVFLCYLYIFLRRLLPCISLTGDWKCLWHQGRTARGGYVELDFASI